MTLIRDKIDLIETRDGNYTLKVIGDDGGQRTLHSIYDPQKEAKSIVDTFQFNGDGILVVLGLGMGYHVAELERRFPDADIVVVEAVPDIYKLAREHGPVLHEKTEIITGTAYAEALKTITKRQVNRGMLPISVFALSSTVSAFPGYYQPLLDSLKKSMSVKIWDRLRYSKFHQERLKITLIDSSYFLLSEVEKTLKSLDHEVVRMTFNTDVGSEAIISGLIELILNFKPDFLFTINHLGFDEEGRLTSFLNSIEMPTASWYVDSPNLIVRAFNKNVSPFTSLFLWDKSYITDMESMGFESVHHLPLGTDETVFKPVTARKHRKKLFKYQCEVGFVGDSMTEAVHEWMEKVEAGLYSAVEKNAEDIAISEDFHGDINIYLGRENKDRINRLSEKEKMDFEAAVLWKATLLYRLSCIKKLEDYGLTIHGDKGWADLLQSKKIKLLPPLNYYKELPLFYNACKINFNATSRQMREAVNQRVFDVPACGAFLLTDYKSALEDMFDVGKEIVTYRHREEIPELARFYLNHQTERDEIVKRGRAKVLKEHTYKNRLERIINAMKGRYA